MLDRLEDPIARPNCIRSLGVLDRHVEAPLGAAHLLGGEGHRREVECAREHGGGGAVFTHQSSGRGHELEPGLLARLVHRRKRRGGECFHAPARYLLMLRMTLCLETPKARTISTWRQAPWQISWAVNIRKDWRSVSV